MYLIISSLMLPVTLLKFTPDHVSGCHISDPLDKNSSYPHIWTKHTLWNVATFYQIQINNIFPLIQLKVFQKWKLITFREKNGSTRITNSIFNQNNLFLIGSFLVLNIYQYKCEVVWYPYIERRFNGSRVIKFN